MKGLEKEVMLPSGYTAGFWVVRGIELDYAARAARLRIALYKDAAARDAGASPVRLPGLPEGVLDIRGADFENYFGEGVLAEAGKTPLSQAYAWIKAQQVFDGAKEAG